MEFSAASALLPKNAQDVKAAEMVISAEATADEPGELPAAPAIEEVQTFKREVEALRGQPRSVQTPLESLQAPTLASVPAAVPEASSALLAGSVPSTELNANSRSDEAVGGASADNSLPAERNPDPAPWTPEDQAQLPKASLDFSMSLPKARRSLRARGSFTPNFRGGVLRLALLTAALVVTAVGATWYKHWLPWQSGARKTSSSRPATAVNGNTSLPPGSQEAANQHSEYNNTKVVSDAPVTSAGTRPPETKDAEESPAHAPASSSSAAKPVVRKTSPSSAIAGKRSTDRPTAKDTADFVAPSAAESALVPPKLIKSVRAVASLDALRDFETGNVVIDAVVGTAGEVIFISVLSGPPSLRASAVESLKQYQYEPATRNGQPVPAHVTITIHFRFEP
jgi:protein TonB